MAFFRGLDEVVRAGSKPNIRVQVREPGGPPPQRAGVSGRQPSRRELNVLHELAHALDGRELDYLTRFFGNDLDVATAIGVDTGDVTEWRRGRPGDRAVVRGILLDTIVTAFGGPEGAVALADRLRELGLGPLKQLGLEMALQGELDPRRGVQVASQGQPDRKTAERVLGLLPMEDPLPWKPGDLLDYVAGDAVPAEVPDGELVGHLGTARAALVAGVDESTAQKWLDGRQQPAPTDLRNMREAARLPSSELVRHLGPGRALEVTDTGSVFFGGESHVWKWLAGVVEPLAERAGKLRRAVLRAIADGFVPPAPFRLAWNENWIREAERRLAWSDAKKGEKFPSDASEQWKKVNDPVPPLRPESRKVIDGLGKSLKASVNYIVVQVLLGNEVAKAMVRGSGIVIPDPGPEAATELLEQIADNLRAAKGMLHSGVLRRVVGGAASEHFQDATGGVVPQLRLTDGPGAVREFMEQRAGDDVHFLVLRIPSAASQDVPQATYVNGNDASAFSTSGDFFKDGQAHYFLDTVQGDGRRIDPESTLSPGVLADAGADLAWWAQHGRLRASAGGSDGGGSAAPASRGEGSQPTAADIVKLLGGPAQVAWLDGQLPRVAELLDLPESVRLDRLGNLAGIAEVAELAGRMEQHLKTMPPGFDPDGTRAFNVERAKRMVRQGAWTSTDLQWVADRLPGMRKVEEIWRDLAQRSPGKGA